MSRLGESRCAATAHWRESSWQLHGARSEVRGNNVSEMDLVVEQSSVGGSGR